VCFIEAWHGAAPGEIDCAIASRQGIFNETTVPHRNDAITNHAEGFHLWL
jgi:hypothetical protein